ncbi:ATP-binding protein [Hydrogenimonas sp.]
MSPFTQIDAVLKDGLERLVESSGGSQAETPFFLSKEKIVKELETPLPHDFPLTELDDLADRLKLEPFEKRVILLLFAAEIDPKYSRVFAYLQDDMQKGYPTVHLIASLFGAGGEGYREILRYFLDEESKLLLLGLVEIDRQEGTPLFASPLKLADSLCGYLLGHYRCEERLRPFSRRLAPDSAQKPDPDLLRKIERLRERYEPVLLHLTGRDENLKKRAALALASSFGFGLLVVECRKIPEEIRTAPLLKALLRDALLGGTLLYFEEFERLLEREPKGENTFLQSLEELSWLTFASGTEPWTAPPGSRIALLHRRLEPSREESRLVWEEGLEPLLQKENTRHLAATLSSLFDFTPERIEALLRQLRLQKELGETVTRQEVVRLCRQRLEGDLHTLAQRLVSDTSLEDIVLPPPQKKALEEALSHFRYQNRVFEEWGLGRHFQSRGLSLLFCGPSGTGKTLAASILANELGLDLYRVELPTIVSKYIGETEKNLAKIFDTSERSGVLLFFDEADALFGKRSEVKDAHDRFANIEVSYLLQRIEQYDGPVVLASNFKKNIDDAFMRRMRFVIDFPLPGVKEREAIWRKMLEGALPLAEVDFALLAERFKLSGAGIRNAALYAAFKAAEAECAIGMEQIFEGIKEEISKSGKTLKERDFVL